MPKVIQLPRRAQPENQAQELHSALILSDGPESELPHEIQRWLELGDTALQNSPAQNKRIA